MRMSLAFLLLRTLAHPLALPRREGLGDRAGMVLVPWRGTNSRKMLSTLSRQIWCAG